VLVCMLVGRGMYWCFVVVFGVVFVFFVVECFDCVDYFDVYFVCGWLY